MGVGYETRDPGTEKVHFAKRIAYLIDDNCEIRKAYDVKDVNTFAATVLTDLDELK